MGKGSRLRPSGIPAPSPALFIHDHMALQRVLTGAL